MSETRDDEERALAAEERAAEIQQAADRLALRGLAGETRDEMEMRHFDERTFGYTTEEFESEMAARHVAELAALEIWERTHEPMTIAAIERDPWAAVDKPIPEALSDELLEVAHTAVVECVEAAERDMLGDPGDVFLVEHIEKRLDAATARLAKLDAREEAREPMTAEAIARDPRNAVRLELPQEMSIDLAALVVDTAFGLREDAYRQAREVEARGQVAAEPFWDLGYEAEQRREEALFKYDMAKAREAWQAPEFSDETIEADAWTAVYLPIPAKADPELLQDARRWADDLARYAERGNGSVLSKPLFNPERHTREDNIEAARARVGELDARLEMVSQEMPAEMKRAADKVGEALNAWAAWQEAAFTFDTMKADPWTAVYLPVPDHADRLLLTRAYSAASVCVDMIEEGRHGPRVPQGNDGPEENLAMAQARMVELEPRILAASNQNSAEERITLVSPAEFFEQTPAAAKVAQTLEALTVEAIERDRWNAVEFAIPEDAGRELLQQAREAAARCVADTESFLRYDYESREEYDGGLQQLNAARARVVELDGRLEIHAEVRQAPEAAHGGAPEWPYSMEAAIKRDPWNAVNLDLPANGSADFYNEISGIAQDLRIHAEERAAAATSIEETEHWHELALRADQRFDNAHVKFYEAAAREEIDLMKPASEISAEVGQSDAPAEIASEARQAPEAATAPARTGTVDDANRRGRKRRGGGNRTLPPRRKFSLVAFYRRGNGRARGARGRYGAGVFFRLFRRRAEADPAADPRHAAIAGQRRSASRPRGCRAYGREPGRA